MPATLTISFLLIVAVLAGAALGYAFGIRPGADTTLPGPTRPRGEQVSGALILFDVDGLSTLNETAGFDTGDRLLDRIGDLLRRTLPSGAGLERLENGRYAVWMPDAGRADATALAETMRDLAARAPVPGLDGTVTRTLSAGLTLVSGGEGRGRALLHADAALLRAKAAGGNRMEWADGPSPAPLLASAADVAEAISSGQLSYHLQPIVRLSDGAMVGVESLVRWERPDGEIIGPDSFVDQLDRFPSAAIDLIADQAAGELRPLIEQTDCYVAFNVTGAVMDAGDGSGWRWLRRLTEHIPADRVVLEIVETAVIVDPNAARDFIDRVRAQGIRIALDDFGAGLSNLDRLRDLPVDIIKIDRAFVSGLGGLGHEEAILSAIAALAPKLDLTVIAEGIEDQTTADTLRSLGIDHGQGWHFGRPVPARNLRLPGRNRS